MSMTDLGNLAELSALTVDPAPPTLSGAPGPIAGPISSPGKIVRWSRFVDPDSRRALLVPIDHGLTIGPVDGLASVRNIARWVDNSAINGVIAHKGMVSRLAMSGLLTGRGVMVHLNGMTAIGETPDTKHMLTSVEAAVRLGADAVSVQVNFAADNHAHNLQVLGRVVDEAARFELPVLAMIYAAGTPTDRAAALRTHRHFLRVGYELGIDAIKTAPPEHLDDLPVLLDGIGEDVAVLFSGGSLTTDQALIELATAVARSRAAGLCVGRNVFQRPDPSCLLGRVRALLDS